MDYLTPGDLAVNEVQKELDELGVRDIKFFLNENLKENLESGKITNENVKLEVSKVLQSYLKGDYQVLDFCNDSKM